MNSTQRKFFLFSEPSAGNSFNKNSEKNLPSFFWLFDTIILFTLGFLFLAYYSSGRISNYLHPFFHIPVLVGGCVLVFLAANRAFTKNKNFCNCNSCSVLFGQSSVPALITRFLLIALPISASFFSNSEFGQTALLNRGVALDYQEIFPFAGFDNDPGNFAWSADPGMDPTTYLAKTPEGRIRAETIDLVLASNEPDLRKDFEDKEVEILGQYLPPEKKLDEEVTNSDFLLVRVFMLCCAADARPIGVSVRGKIPQSVQPSDWVLVRGFARFLRKKQTFSPLVEATEILPTAPPQQRNLFHNN